MPEVSGETSPESDYWGSLAPDSQVRWLLMMAGITVLPDLPAVLAPGGVIDRSRLGYGALVEGHDGYVRVEWNAPVALAGDDDGERAEPGLSRDQFDQRRRTASKAMLTAIAEILNGFTVEFDTENWSHAKVTSGPGPGWD